MPAITMRMIRMPTMFDSTSRNESDPNPGSLATGRRRI
jgi:hypothetical protein